MKTFKLIMADGTSLEIEAVSVDRDGQGVHLRDADGNMVATFSLEDVRSAYPIPKKRSMNRQPS